MKLKTQIVKWKGLLLATALLLMGSGVVQAQVKVHGNIYGGGEKANVVGSDTVRIHGVHNDTILGNVFGGGLEGQVSVNTIVEISNGVIGDSTELLNHLGTDSIFYGLKAYNLNGGRVYGGGQGDDANETYGAVLGNTYVNVSGSAKIHNNVYGGGMLGSVGTFIYHDVVTDSIIGCESGTGIATVIISGGEIGPLNGSGQNAYIFGGGRGQNGSEYRNFANVDSTSVIVCDSARIYGSIFGGSEDGHVLSDARVQLMKGNNTNNRTPVIGTNGLTSWDGNIFGGGRNFNYSSLTAGRVDGNIRVDMSDGELKGNLYGGGRLGLTGMVVDALDDVDTIPGFDHGNITVNISGGTVGSAVDAVTIGNVFGGGKGIVEDADGSLVYVYESLARVKSTFVNIYGNARVHGSVYGGGELGKVCNNTNVRVYENAIIGSEVSGSSGTRYNGSVYGGGKGYDGTALDGLHDPGEVWGSSTVSIEGGQVMENVYGGGELASVGQMTNGMPLGGGDIELNLNSLSKVTVTGGQVGPLDGTGLNGYVFGGGQGVGDDEDEDYRDYANVIRTLVTVDIQADADTTKNRIWSSVYGGSADGHVWNDTKVEMKSGVIGTTGKLGYDGDIFGGGQNYLHTNHTAGRVGGNTMVEMTNGTIFGDIYGGGSYGLTGVDEHGTMQTGNHGNTKVIVKGGTIGNVNEIETFTASSMGNIYGGGKGYFEDKNGTLSAESALLLGLTKNTEIIIKDSIDNDDKLVTKPHVYGIVLGGGEIANVGHYTLTKDGSGNITDIAVADGTGTTKVKISGGIIGGDKTRMRTDHYGPWLGFNDDLGYVYGGGEGWSDDPDNYKKVQDTSILDLIATVQSTEVEISGSAWVKASVFGGAESGHVKKDTKVTISGGQIGAGYYEIAPDVVKDSLYVDSQFVRPDTVAITDGYALHGTAHWVYGADDGHGNTVYNPFDPELLNQNILPSDGKSWFGNVFGGGSGWFPYVEETSSEVHSHWYANSGKVWGNTEVIITGGHILNNVYGANESTDVGGKATVKMSGGTVGVPLTNAQIIERPLSGYIYGGGCGDPRSIFDNLTNVDTTDVQITGGIIYGSVMGGAEDGHILGDAKVTIGQDAGKTTVIGTSGKSNFDGNVFGGGRNFFGDNKNAGHVNGHTTINMSDGLAMGNIYGGGRSGSVLKSAHVNISGGKVGTEQIGVDQATIVNGSVFGGGLGFAGGKNNGNAHEFANVDSTYVNISGDAMIYNTVFGGGDNGHVLKSTVVMMTGGTVGQKNTLRELLTDNQEQYVSFVYTGNVLGGGKGVTPVYLGVYNDTTGIVFGNTNITIEGGVVRHSVYGGGGLSHVGTFVEKSDDTIQFATNTGVTKVIVKGEAHIGPTKEDLTQPTEDDLKPDRTGYAADITTQQYIDTVFKYLGGNSGMVFGAGCGLSGMVDLTYNDSTFVSIAENAQVIGSVYGGGDNGHVARHTKVDIKGGTIGGVPLHGTSYTIPNTNVFYSSTPVTLHLADQDSEIREDKFGTGRRVIRGEVYGGGKGTDFVTTDVYSPTAGRVLGNTNVTVRDSIDGTTVKFSPTIFGRVYGGGSIASVGKFTYHQSSFPTTNIALTDSIQRITYKKGTGITNVTISGGQIGTDGMNNGDVVGGGRGLAGNPHGYDTINPSVDGADQVVRLAYVNSTNVTLNDNANVKSNVYGGSLNGHVYSDTHVNMDGGTVGYAYMDEDTLKVHGAWHSNVYGGGGGTSHYKVAGMPDHLSITSGRVFGNTNVTITGGHVYHNVYGGGPIASVGTYDLRSGKNPEVSGTGTATVTIEGGTIGLDSYEQGIYDLGKFGYDGHENGMVFGSGRGEIDSIGAYSDSLTFAIRTNVTIGNDEGSGPIIKGSVYGSGENGHVYLKSMVNVKGGTIGCLPAEYDKYAAAPETYADQLNHFSTRGNVYGGGCGTDMFTDSHDGKKKYNPQSGIVWGDAEVNISGGYISRNVYGGGAMASVGYFSTEERHTGDTLSWPMEFNYLLGGKTEVNITGGHIGTADLANVSMASGNVFGSSRGKAGTRYEMLHFANVKEAYVTVDFTTPDGISYNDNTQNVIIGSVFGGGESGHVYDTTSVTIEKGFVVGSVCGAGDGSATYKDILLDINDDHEYLADVHSITAGKVFGNTSVNINGGRILHNVYGGGNMASVGKGNYILYGEGTHNETPDITNALNSGRAWVNIYGGIIGIDGNENGHVFGSSRGLTHISFKKDARYKYNRDYFLGYTNHSIVTIGETAKAKPDASSPSILGSVFGGGQNGHVRLNTEVVINDATIGAEFTGTAADINNPEWMYRGNVYGAGRGTDFIPGTTRYCSSAGSVTRNTHVVINGGQIHHDVYGGGLLATVGPPDVPKYVNFDPSLTTVDIVGGTIGSASGVAKMYGGNVYGSSRGKIAEPGHLLDTMATVKEAIVNIGAKNSSGVLSGNALINGSVYGSGENGHVTTNATINIYGGHIGDLVESSVINEYCGNVFGAGSGTDMYDSDDDDTPDAYNPLAGIVKGNTTINIEGGWVMRNVYGGGEMASVGTISNDTVHAKTSLTLSWPYNFVYGNQTGKATINIKGGRIGITGKHYASNNKEYDNGDVYGGGKGKAMSRYMEAHFANVKETEININYIAFDNEAVNPTNYKDTTGTAIKGCIAGAVYAGSENGHVNGNTYINFRRGLIGHAIYGAGKGKGKYQGNYSNTAGKVYGNTYINIVGAHRDSLYVVRSVFGGGNLASVGKGNYIGIGETQPTDPDELTAVDTSGRTYVNIYGGTLGVLNPTEPGNAFKDSIPYGSVFGGCRGKALNITDITQDRFGFVNKTFVTIGDPTNTASSPLIYGSVYGGAQDGHVLHNTEVSVNGGEIGVAFVSPNNATTVMGNTDYESWHWTERGNVYGGGSGIGLYDEDDPTTYNKLAGSVLGTTKVEVKGGTIHRDVYGGGNLASVLGMGTEIGHDTVKVTITDNALVGLQSDINGSYQVTGFSGQDSIVRFSYGGNVFGAGKGFTEDTFAPFCNVLNTKVEVNDGNVYGDVYGGGENGHVTNNTNVLITGTASVGLIDGDNGGTSTFDGNVFGGGKGSGRFVVINNNGTPDDPDDDIEEYRIYTHAGRVGGNTNVTMNNGEIQGTIFGGGRLALVGVDEDGSPFLIDETHVYDSVSDHGLATITVSGGIIGNDNPDKLLNGSDESVGDIFGSGKGDVKNYEDIMAGRVANTSINISGDPTIYGSVFGGGEMAGIGYWDTDAKFYGKSGASEVTIDGEPVIGTDKEFRYDYAQGTPSHWTVYNNEHKLIHTCTGNVYGGSQGDVDTISPHWVSMARSRTAKVIIKGNPTIRSRVFGGAEQGSVADNTWLTVNGGTIGSLANYDSSDETKRYLFGGVYGGGFGSQNPAFNGTTMHDGTAIVNDSTESHSEDGLWTANYLAGRTYGDVHVDLLGGIINGDVYGGSEYAYIGGYGNNPGGKAILYIGNKTQVGNPDVGVTIVGNVYGANNYGGTPMDSVLVHIYHTKHTADDQVDSPAKQFAIHNVFGGGNESNYTPNQGVRTTYPRSAMVHVYNCENTIEELYGGGNAADVGTSGANTDANIIVEGGRLRRVFGGGKGDNTHNVSANIYGTAHTQVQGGYIEAVYGGGNQMGSILATDLIVDHIGSCDMQVDSIFGGSNEAPVIGDLNTTIACSDGVYENIYGGANNADITGNVTLNILGSTITNAFGGSKGSEGTSANIKDNPATVVQEGNVTLNIFGGSITNAFGGSDMNGNIEGVVTVNVIDTLTGCDLNLINVYGGSKATALTADAEVTASPVVNIINGTVKGDVFGGSYGETATTTSNPQVNIGYNAATMSSLLPACISTPVDTVKGNVYGGGSLANTVGNTTVNIYQGVVGNISYEKTSGSADFDTIIHVANSGHVFGGGKGSTDTIFDSGHHVVVLPENLAKVIGDTRVNIKGGKVLYSVYGGGELSSVSDTAFVTVTGGQVGPAPRMETGFKIPVGLNGHDGYVFGGGKGIGLDSIVTNPYSPYFAPYGKYYKFANVNNTLVTVNIPIGVDTTTNRLWGSVFGGAEDGHVLGNANVRYVSGFMGTMGTTSYDGNIFGGGRNYEKMNYTAGRVGGDINVEMTGGQLFGNIYGGGRLALTGINEKGEQIPGDGHGNVKVIVKGGKIGNENLMESFTKYAMGNVYGGGKGSMDSLKGHPAASALLVSLTRNTDVEISQQDDAMPTIIYGSVFGGGEVANVGYFDWDTIINPKTGKLDIANITFKDGDNGHTKVVVSGGRIGADRMKMRYDLATDGTYNFKYNDDIGHVYGGGEGIVANPANYDTINPAVIVDHSSPAPHYVTVDDFIDGDEHNYRSLIDLMSIVQSSEVTINGNAWVKGSVYGGGANGHVTGNTMVKIQGGQIGAGDNGIKDWKYTEEQFLTDSLPECVHWRYGYKDSEGTHYYPCDPVDISEGKIPSDGKSWFGNVFGGGSGFYPYIVRNTSDTADSTVWNPESGKVYGKAQVEITGGHILNNVYGGCETTDVMDSAIVVMRGGTLGVPRTLRQIDSLPVTCYLFGAGKGDPRTRFNTWTNVENVRVEVSGGWIYGSVFGGGEEGHVIENVKLTVKGNTGTNEQAIAGEATKIGTLGYSYVDGNIFGAGRGFSGEALTAGVVGGNVTVNIEGGEMLGSIYGGGRLASVGTEFANPTLPSGEPNPHYGHMQDGDDHGMITVNISGGVIGNDNESTLTHTKGGNVFGGSMGRLELLDGTTINPKWPSLAKVKQTKVNITNGTIKSNVYGGGELGSVLDSATVIVAGGVIMREVYGGGYGSDNYTSKENDSTASPMQIAGRVLGNTLVKLNGGWVKKSVYGGGEMASVGYITDSIIHPETGANSTFNLSWPWEFVYADGTGNANVVVTGGRVGVTGEDNGNIYGGGKGLAGDRYVMAHCANVNNAVVNIAYTDNTATPDNYLTEPINSSSVGCIAGAVFGGGEYGHVNDSTSVTLTKGLVGHAVFGGGKGSETYINAGKVYGNTHVNIQGGYVVRSVYGGGDLASVGKGNYAGGVGDYNPAGYGEVVTESSDWTIAQNSGHTYVNILGGVLGRLDPLYPDTVFQSDVPYGSVFGGCRGLAVGGEWDSVGFVNYTHVKIGADGSSTGPRLYGSVFGGAQDGHVRWTTNTVVNSGEIGVDYGGTATDSVASGSTDINSKYWIARGNVFGGGSGIGMYDSNGDEVEDSYSHIAGSVLKSANVTVNGGTIHRNVYGGGNLASVGPPRYGQHDCDSSRSLVKVNINSEIGHNTTSGYGGYVYGGSKGRANPDGESFPYKDFAYTSHTRVNLNDGARVSHDVFGGGENGQVGTPHVGDTLHASVINIFDGAVIGGSVYGGGQGTWGLTGYTNDTISGRVMGSTRVNLNNSQVVGNIYGGGALGVVMDSAVVVIAGGEVHDVFGAGSGYVTKDRKANADVTTATRVNINGGTVHGSVYGGGENGSVGFLASEDATVTTNVNLNGGHMEHSAYGGGKNGFSRGGTFMNVNGTCVVDENVFGGAYGRIDTVFVAGLRTVNMRGGTVKGSVYGGSYNANDALVFTPRPFDSNDTIVPACIINYSGGQTEQNVFGAGYFGRTFGSTYVFVGERAITSAPNHSDMVAPYNETYFHDHKDLVIKRDIWSGADFGTVEPGSGSGITFGGPTITGRSDIYIDGFGYDTRNSISQNDNKFMDIGENVFGCGTLNDGGRTGKIIMMRDYGYDVATGDSDPEPWATATRDMKSIQQADSLIIESSHIKLAGRGIVSDVYVSESFTLYDIMNTVRIVNGSSLYIDKPVDNIGNLYSVVGSNLYDNPTYVAVNFDDLVPIKPGEQDERYDNKIRINQGTHVKVKMLHDDGKSTYSTYGALTGFFHMMTDGEYNAFAYARPKNSTVHGNEVYSEHDNPNDGGFVSYRGADYNIYSVTGDTTVGPFVQMPYENHTPAQSRQGERYYRVWRYFQSAISVLEVQLVAIAQNELGFTAYVPKRQVELPPGHTGDYYKLKQDMGVANINYGSEIKTVNAGVKNSVEASWMYSDGINFNYVSSSDPVLDAGKNFMRLHPNNAFGVTMIPTGGFVSDSNPIGDTVLLCTEANTPLINSKWDIVNTSLPTFDFRLTHYNKITGNYQWDPISIFLEHYNSNNELIGEVEIKVTITTQTKIGQDNDVDTYALMVHTQPAVGEGGGDHHDVYSARVLMPTYTLSSSDRSEWTVTDVKWFPNTKEGFNSNTLMDGEPYDTCMAAIPQLPTSEYVGMTMSPTRNYDNTNGWTTVTTSTVDLGAYKDGNHPFSSPIPLGEVDPRIPFSIQFDLHYDSKQNVGVEGNDTIGRIEVSAHFTNSDEASDVKFNVYVHRRGKGRGFYIDGQHGEFAYSGHYPNAAQPSLAGIFYFTDFEPSDTIYIVDRIDANAVDNLSWDGREYNQVNIFRYNGGHPLYKEASPGAYYAGYDMANNPAYKGVLVDVQSSMSMHSIILDGACLKKELKGDPDEGTQVVASNVISEAPMFRIHNNAQLSVFGGEGTYTSLNNNYNAGCDGGAVDIKVGGTLKMGQNAFMDGNYVKDSLTKEHHGGAIHIDEYAELLLSDSVMINSNYHVNAVDHVGENDTVSQNVYIAHYNTVISVGPAETADQNGPLNAGSRIGVTKTAWNDMDYMPVVYTEDNSHGDNLLTNGSYALGQIIYDELHQYGLLEYPYREVNEDPNCLNKLYFAKTWVNQVTSVPEGYNASAIDTPEELAWAISVVNGYNTQTTAAPGTNFTLTKDIDMSRYIWLPIGDATNNYSGTFDGNGYMVSGIRSALSIPEKGMFGSTQGATIKNLQAKVDLFTRRKVEYLGGIIGVMDGGVLSNVESAGYLQGASNTKGIGGLVGKALSSGTKHTIHSCFALDTLNTVSDATVLGGLVGDNACDLYNSYSNFIVNQGVADTIGGLVGINRATGHVQNCYSAVEDGIHSIVYKNEAEPGFIKVCYSNSDDYHSTGTAPQGHGTYSDVLDRNDFGYMYKDNLVTLEDGQSVNNSYYCNTVSYDNYHTVKWRGLLYALNKWVAVNPVGLTDPARWFRPTTEKINNDLPVLAFKSDSAIAVVDDIAFLRYSKDFDFLLDTTNKLDAQSSMFLYGNAIEVENVPDEEVKVFVNEDAVLMQKAGSADFNNTTTGVTFDNSCKAATDAFGGNLDYDWHLLSSPLSNAPMGISYNDMAQNWWFDDDHGQIDSVMNSYMPNRIDTLPQTTVKWDYYTYYEPEYHWINFKRNSSSHAHYDYPHASIAYENELNLVPAKGYMMAISEDSYLSNTGTLNRDKISIPVTAKAPIDEAGLPSYNKGSNLVGNPYQAYLDLDKVAEHNIRLGNTSATNDTLKYFYIYDADMNVYAPYTPTASKNPEIPSRYIHPHQGFFVLYKPHVADSITMNMEITPSMAGTTKEEGSYLRGEVEERIDYPLVDITAKDNKGNRDLAIVELARPELGGVEKVENLQNSDFKLYTHMGDKNYSLLFTPIGTKKVPLFFKTPEDGKFTLTWNTYNGTFRKMLLIDNITGAEYDMLAGNSYSFNGHAADYAARFYIVFELDNTINIDIDDEDFAFFDGTQWVVVGDGQLELIDVTGRILQTYSMNSQHNHVSFDHVAAGTYMLRLVKGRNNVKTQKIVIY